MLYSLRCTSEPCGNAAQGTGNRPETIAAWVDEMLHAIARDLVPHRPCRSEPRAVKRRLKTNTASPGPDARWAISRTETPPPQNNPNRSYLSAIQLCPLRIPALRIRRVIQCGLLALDGVVEEGADFLLGRWLVGFEGQHVVGIRLDDFPGDPSLAAHGV